MNRRSFTRMALQTTALAGVASALGSFTRARSSVRLGGPVFDKYQSPDEWIAALKKQGYRAAYCPVKVGTPAADIRAYEQAARQADIVISEVGAWSNPISPDPKMAREAFKKCVDSLALAEDIGANCCVNISGSKNSVHWAGPHPNNLSQGTFDEIVEVTRKILNEVQPTRTYFALEPMPWTYPDSADSYLRLIKAINHRRFGVHMDPMNLVVSPRSFYGNEELIRECFKKLGPHIRSCHGKDIILKEDTYTPQLFECRPGLGSLDYGAFLTELSKLPNIPLMMEHLTTAEEYQLAATYIRTVGEKQGITL
ncbi:sugar phosphate isomerase/epimerase [Telluribacter sp.]|jgi:sugar phosphate isomerase/epimerase|uniref:sugar phosphate isomerase/epimerase family protein n=1 Tax=Telluribacter sp. TaxID=1978767 RepID=UPI002E139930|nr:sugar phosphate isomerase/epimerase [Telluribacter sp.]